MNEPTNGDSARLAWLLSRMDAIAWTGAGYMYGVFIPAAERIEDVLAALDAAMTADASGVGEAPKLIGLYCDRRDIHHEEACDKQCQMCADSNGTAGVPVLPGQQQEGGRG